MSGIQTNWILNLVDKVTDPIKDIINSTNKFNSKTDEAREKVEFTGDALKDAFGNAKKYVDELKNKLKVAEREYENLNQEATDAAPGRERAKANRQLQQQKEKVERVRKELKGAEEDLRDIEKQTKKVTKETQRWEERATAVNQTLEIIDKASSSLEFAAEVQTLTTHVQRMTDLSGAALDMYVAKSRRIAAVYNEDAEKIARAANVMTSQLGGSYEQNFKLIEDGFKKGANINGDFLDQLLEYPAQIREMGMGAADMISIITQANKDGVYSDKALDSMKEGGLALREMGQAQIDALGGINLKVKDLEGKTSWEALQLVSKAMNSKDLKTQEKQLVLANIFKGAGEDAGRSFIESFGDGLTPLDQLPEVEETGAGLKAFFADISTWIGQKAGVFAIYAQQFSPVVQLITGAIPIMQSLGVFTKIATAAQWLWNAALTANPIGIVIVAVGALIGIIALAWNKFEGFRTVIFKGWEALKLFGKAIKTFVIEKFKSMLSGITGIGKALMHFFRGEWTEAWETGKGAVYDLSGIGAGAKAIGEVASGWSDSMDAGQKASDDYTRKRQEKEAKEKASEGGFSVQKYMNGDAPTLAFNPQDKDKKKKKGKKAGDGLSVSGQNGARIITMNLDVKNYFNTRGSSDRDMADKIVGHINDRLKDALVIAG